MYTRKVPYKDYKNNPRTEEVNFNLDEREVIKLLNEFKIVTDWYESMTGPRRELETADVVMFYTAFEEILLSAWGVPSEDGRQFRKEGRYDFEQSALFNAAMMEFLTNPKETQKFVEEIVDINRLNELMARMDTNLDSAVEAVKGTDREAELRREIEELRKQLPSKPGGEQQAS